MNDERIEKIVREKIEEWSHDTYTTWKDGIDVEKCKYNCRRCQIEALIEPLSEVVRQTHAEAIRAAAEEVPDNFRSDGTLWRDVIRAITPTLVRIEAELRMAEAVHEEACRWFNKCQFKSPKAGPTHMAEIMEYSVFAEVEETDSRVATLRRERDAEKAKEAK